MVGEVVGEVIESNDPRAAPGDFVEGMLGWQEYAVAPAKTLRKIDCAVSTLPAQGLLFGGPARGRRASVLILF